jgi:ABC-2 type transport system permease protein
MDLLVWGFVTTYLEGLVSSKAVAFLLGGMILWDVLFRAQQAVSLSVLQEMWVGNLLNIFVAPIRAWEFIAATCVMGILRAGATVVVIGILAYLFYAFNIMDFKWALVPLFAQLIVFGWAVGLFTVALILRYGEAVESLAWAVPFLLQPVCAVFYPVATLPYWLQKLALALPCTYIFESMRELLQEGSFNWQYFFSALLLNLAYLALTGMFLARMLRIVRENGYLTKTVRT